MQRIVILLIALFTGVSSYAQSSANEQKAFQNFKQAREAYDQGNYETAADLLLQTKELLGSTNIRIQPMLIKSLVKIENWQQAKVEIPAYFALNPDPELVEYQEIKSLQTTVLSEAQKEDNAWALAVDSHDTEKYKAYLETYPYGAHRSDAEKSIQDINSQLDNAAYQKAISDGSQQALSFYLSNYPDGSHRDEVSRRLSERKENDLYQKAKNNNYVENYEDYIRQYPNGKYASEARQIIENSYFKIAEEAYAEKDYYQARNFYRKYQENYPNGANSKIVASKLKKTESKLNQKGARFLLYTYDTESPIGISTIRLNVNKLGFYYNLKMNSDIFKFSSVSYDVDDNGESDRPGDIKMTGEKLYANVALSIGATFKLAYPLYGYLGAGFGYYPVYEEAKVYYSSSGDYWENDWLKNTDQTESVFFPEGGLLLNLGNKMVLKYGVMYHEEIVHQFGIGIKF